MNILQAKLSLVQEEQMPRQKAKMYIYIVSYCDSLAAFQLYASLIRRDNDTNQKKAKKWRKKTSSVPIL